MPNAMPIAAIRYDADDGAQVDRLLVRLADALSKRSVRVFGAVQHNSNDGDRRCDGMQLADPSSGRRVTICEDVTDDPTACRIDETALAEAIGWTDAALDAGGELLIVNKFGKREAAGRGFADVLGRAVTAQVPVLVGVSDRNAEAWATFTGGRGAVLPPDYEALESWCLAQTRMAMSDPAS